MADRFRSLQALSAAGWLAVMIIGALRLYARRRRQRGFHEEGDSLVA
jgi:hypothetical protein